jgi:hypothetical protein
MAASSRASASEEVSEVLWISCPVADFSQLAILGRKFCSFLHFGLLLHVGYLRDLNEMLILVLAKIELKFDLERTSAQTCT